MGRNVTNTTTTKAIITENVPTTFTTVYNNTSGAAAELLGININGTADSTVFTESTGASEWTYFGSHLWPAYTESGQSSRGFGVPYPVQLDDDRVLFFFLPHYQHQGGNTDFMTGNTVHAQIVEYTGGRYRAGPITNLELPSTAYSDATYSLWSEPEGLSDDYNQPNWRAVALSSTKVVAAYRIRNSFRLMRFTITGNSVDRTVESLDLTGASFFNTSTANAFDLAIVPGATDQVIVGGWAASNWSVQAYSIPNSGALTSLTSLTSTTISSSTYHFSFCQMVKTPTANVTPYIIAGATGAATAEAIVMTYNSSTNTFATSGSRVSLTNASGNWHGIMCECLSSNTSPNAVIATVQSSTSQVFSFYRQINGAQAFASISTINLQHTSDKGLQESFRWGDGRAVFTGQSQVLVVIDDQGIATNLIPNTESTRTERTIQYWWPFNSKPLYNVYDTQAVVPDRVCQLYSRKNVANATDVGDVDRLKTYIPLGHDRGVVRAWNEAANCWIVGQHGRIYAIDIDGNILSEVSLYELASQTLSTNTYLFRIGSLTCLPSGRILFSTIRHIGSVPSSSYLPQTGWASLSTTNYLCVTDPVTNGAELAKTKLQKTPFAATHAISCNMTAFTEQTDETTTTERAFHFAIFNQGSSVPQGYVHEFNGTEWANEAQLGITSASQTTQHTGWHPNFKFIQDTPCSTAYPSGLWRVVGSYAMNSLSNYRRVGISNPFAEGSFGSINTANIQLSSVDETVGYGITMFQYENGKRTSLQVAGMYDEGLGKMRVWSSIDGRLNSITGWRSDELTETDNRFMQAAVSKFAYAISFQNTDVDNNTAKIYVFNKQNVDTPEDEFTTTTGNGWATIYETGKTEWQIFGTGIDKTYLVAGIPETIKFFLKLNDGSGTDFFLNNGQVIELASKDEGLFRATDLYNIPSGYNIQIRCDTPRTITTLLSIKEYI